MAVAAVCMLGATSVKAQEFTIQGDFVSSYVWRGIYQGGAASFQPTLGFSAGNFSLTAWGSTSLSESNKEIDLTAAYKFGETGPVLSVATLWWDGQGPVTISISRVEIQDIILKRDYLIRFLLKNSPCPLRGIQCLRVPTER